MVITNHVNFATNRNGKFAYVTVGGAKRSESVSQRRQPALVATIPVGELPHGIWPSGDGSRGYVALDNGVHCVAIDTLTNKVIANIPIGQTTQALVYVPNAVPNGAGTENLIPLGIAANAARLQLDASGNAPAEARATVAVNSIGLLDLLEIAAVGSPPDTSYQVYLAESNHAPFGKLEPLAVLKTNPYGWSIVQAIGPLKVFAGNDPNSSAPQRFLVVTDIKNPSQVVLRQADAHEVGPATGKSPCVPVEISPYHHYEGELTKSESS